MAPILPEGVAIFLPDLPQPQVSELVEIWPV
jgi:phage tail protein X